MSGTAMNGSFKIMNALMMQSKEVGQVKGDDK